MHCTEGHKGKVPGNGAFYGGGLQCVTVFTYIERTRSCETSPMVNGPLVIACLLPLHTFTGTYTRLDTSVARYLVSL